MDLLRLVVALLELLALAALMLPTACQPQEHDLPFETIEQGGTHETRRTDERWEAKEPGLIVIAASEDLAQIDDLFTTDAQTQLQEVDFDAYFAVAAFLGWQHSGHEGIQIERAVRRGDELSVYGQVGNLTGHAMETSPYHLVKMRKEDNWDRMIRFTLYLDGDGRHVAVPFHSLIVQITTLEAKDALP